MFGEHKLTYEKLATLLSQIEACPNSQPLHALSNDPSDLTALTPGHLLIEKSLVNLPESSLLEVNEARFDGPWCQEIVFGTSGRKSSLQHL